MFQPDSLIVRILQRLGSCILLTVLWLVFSLPIVTIGAATSAFYNATRGVLVEENGTSWNSFWHSFMRDFRPATKYFLCILVADLILWQGIRIMAALSETTLSAVLQGILILVAVLLLALSCYVLPYISRFQNSLRTTVFNCLRMSIFYMPKTIVLLIGILIIGVLIRFLPPLVILLPGIVMWLWCWYLERIFSRHLPPKDDKSE